MRNQQKTANPWYLCGKIICKSFFQAGPLNAGCKLAVALFFGCFNGDWRRIWWRCKCHDISTTTRALGFTEWMNKNDQFSGLSYSSTLDALHGFLNHFDNVYTFWTMHFHLAAACRTMMFVISTRSRCFPWLRFHRTPLGKENVKLDIEVSCLKHARGSPAIHGMVICEVRLQINYLDAITLYFTCFCTCTVR